MTSLHSLAPISDPQPTPTKKEITSKALREKHKKYRAEIAGRVLLNGPTYKADEDSLAGRKWSSLRPNENLMLACLLGSYGLKKCREAEGFDQVAYEESQAAMDGWAPRPWKGQIYRGQVWCETTFDDGHWEALSAQPAPAESSARDYTPVFATGPLDRVVTDAGINLAYQEWAANPETKWGDFQVALMGFARANGRLQACKTLVWNAETDQTSDGITADFCSYVIDRITAGKYRLHDGQIHKWIGVLWARDFFPKVQTAVYSAANLTVSAVDLPINEDTGQDDARIAGQVYWDDVDFEQAQRDMRPEDAPPLNLVRDVPLGLDDPTSEYYQKSETMKIMLRAIAEGGTKKDAAKAVCLSVRQVDRLIEAIKPSATLAAEIVPAACCPDALPVSPETLKGYHAWTDTEAGTISTFYRCTDAQRAFGERVPGLHSYLWCCPNPGQPSRTCCTDAHEDGVVDLNAAAEDDSGESIDLCAAAAQQFEEFLTPTEVAKILRVHRDSVIRRFEGRPGVLDLGAPETGKKRQYRVLRIPRAAVDRFIAEHRAA